MEPKIQYIECDLTDDQKLGDWRRKTGESRGRWSARQALRRLAHRLGR